jgi:hypothetical protein
MVRRTGTALALALCASASAGCGGSSLRAIAFKQARYSHVPHAMLKRSETVQIERSRWTMVWMKGRSVFRFACPSTNLLGLQPCEARYLVVGVKQGTHSPGLGWGLSSSQVVAIERARQASRRFRIFPDFMGIGIHCAIPRANLPGGTLPGICSTVATPVNHVRRVEFIEAWNSKSSRWVVALSRDGRVHSIRLAGQPPQLWK